MSLQCHSTSRRCRNLTMTGCSDNMAEHNTGAHVPLETRDAPQVSLSPWLKSLLISSCQLLHSFHICSDLFSLALGQGAALTKGTITSQGCTAPSTQPACSLSRDTLCTFLPHPESQPASFFTEHMSVTPNTWQKTNCETRALLKDHQRALGLLSQ